MGDQRPDCPVLAAGTRVVRQSEGGEVRWVVRAGGSGKYLRVGEREAVMLGLVDGNRTAAEIATAFTARAKEPVTAADVEGFVSRMREMEVVQPTAEMRNLLLVEKARQRRSERLFAGKWGAVLFWRVPLLDPDGILTFLERRVRWVFTPGFLVLAGILVALAAGTLVARGDEVFARLRDFTQITRGAGLSLAGAWATALTIVMFHELAHGVACKHWGGEVREMGFLLLFFQPCFYCNVNDAWTFDSRAQRLWVTAAGGFVELVLGSACVLLWAATDEGTALHGVCYLVFMISLSSTLLFNLNPLIKLDGYYLLADLLRMDNLSERSRKQVAWLVRGKLLGMPAASAAKDRREAWILASYGIASILYMSTMLLVIAVLLLGSLGGGEGPGFFMTMFFLFLGWMMLRPALKTMGEAMREGATAQVARHGAKGALLRAAAGAGALLLAAILVPWTRTTGAAAPAEPARVAEVRSPLRGRIAEVLVAEGDDVAEGAPLLRIEAPVEAAEAVVERENATRLRREALGAHSSGDAARAAGLEDRAEAARLKAEGAEARLAKSLLPSPLAGTVLTRRAGELAGSPVTRNASILRVGDLGRLRFRALLDARGAGPVREGMDASVRFRDRPGDPLEGKVVAVSRAPVDPAREPRAKDLPGPHWEVIVETGNPDRRVLPGMVGEVRVVLGRTSLAGALLGGIRGAFRPDLLR
ncbi:MAG: HlyD family efflux transporter periplasmic adaptor subunit [Planctomycetes bacterium]|nr:HlyD family efflux transporter periplasmic adaptor subunit [Planctomycetota bacterium]